MSSARTTGSWMMILLSVLGLAALIWFSVNRQFEGGLRDAVAAMVNPGIGTGSLNVESQPQGSGEIAEPEASLLLKLAKNRADVSAELPQGTEQARIWELLSEHYRNGQLSYRLALHDASDHDPAWIAHLPALLETLLRDNKRPDLHMLLTRDKAELSGAVDSQERKQQIMEALNTLFDDGRLVEGELAVRAEPSLAASLEGGRLELDGKLPEFYKSENYANRLKEAYKADSLEDRIVYDDKIADLGLLAGLPDATAYLREEYQTPGFSLTGGKLHFKIESATPEIDNSVSKKLASLIPDTVFKFDIVEPVEDSQDKVADTEKPVIDDEPESELLAVNFGYNSADLTADSYEALDRLLERLQNDAELRITIEGHTDSAGDPDSNRYLSTQRALSVKHYLMDAGIEEARLKVQGLGDTQPIASNETREGRYKNRRIEIRKDTSS
ncbi:MAG: OmpA family protein [Gammaproteobacteria bacterium]|nr:OmpA family protein [Gammaproteobacteria bacterium]